MMLPEPPSLPFIAAKDLMPLFTSKLVAAAATFAEISEAMDAKRAIADYLTQNNISDRLSYDPRAAEWLKEESRPLNSDDKVRVTYAHRAIAETGTLVFVTNDQSPNLSHFLPDIEIVLLRKSFVRPHLEEVLAEIKQPLTRGATMPRGVFCVTGPSRSADIEQTLLMGAHGPRYLHVIIWDDEKAT